ncbi:10382_t:CDS:1, partial [Racocetra persica]
REDKNFKTYYLIFDDDTKDAYFCFEGKVKEGWDVLSKNPSPLNIEVEYEENEQNGRIYKRATAL